MSLTYMALQKIMDIIENKCGSKRGCEIDYALPHDSEPQPFSSDVLPAGHDLQPLVPISYAYLDRKLEAPTSLSKMAA